MISTELSIRGRDGHVVIALSGELDLSDAGYVAAALTAVADREPWIVADLTGLAFIDTSGADALARGRAQARKAGGDMLVAASQREVVRILASPALDTGFSVYASLEEAEAALINGVTELVLSHLHVDPGAFDWAGQLRTVARDFRGVALKYPHVVPLLVTRPLATPLVLRPPGTLRPLESILTLLTRAGFSATDALHAYRALFGFLYGHILNELRELTENPAETDAVRLGLYRLPLSEFPVLRGLAPVLASYDGAAELERGMDFLLAGLRAD
jgi:anti-anti-sigma factor